MIVNNLDLGPYALTTGPATGQLGRSVVIEGRRESAWGGGSRAHQREVVVDVVSQAAIGGQTAGLREANRYLVQQLQELADNADLNPVYIQWRSGGGLTIPDAQDGWWRLDNVDPQDFSWPRHIPVRIQATEVALGPVGPQSVMRSGAQLVTTYSGVGVEATGYPVGAANQPATAISRVGAEGTIPLTLAPAIAVPGSLPFNPPATVAGFFTGGVRVFDTVNTGTNPVPTAGLFVNANWVEVFASDHRYEGDCVVTNGLLLAIIATGQTRVCRAYLWSTAQVTPAWVQVGDLQSNDNGGNLYTLRSLAVQRVGLEEVAVVTKLSTSIGTWTEVTIRLQRGQYFARADVRPLSQSNTANAVLFWTFATNIKIAYNSASVQDPVISGTTSMAIPTDYGYLVGFTANASQPFLSGLLNLNKPNAAQSNATNLINVGDTTGPAQNAVGFYGFFAVPFGTSTDTTQRLQAEAESGVKTGGYVSAADAAASNGNAVKLPSGTAPTPLDFSAAGTFVLPAGNYVVAARVRTGTAGAGTNNEFAMGLHDGVGFIGPSGKNLRPVDVTTGYLWYYGPVFTYSGNARFYLASNALTTVDWFIDEWVLMVLTQTTAGTGPQEIWQQFLMDLERELQRAA